MANRREHTEKLPDQMVDEALYTLVNEKTPDDMPFEGQKQGEDQSLQAPVGDASTLAANDSPDDHDVES